MRRMRPARAISGFVVVCASACSQHVDTHAAGPTQDPQGVIVPGQVPVISGWDVYPVPVTAALPPVPRPLTVPSLVHGELQTGDMVVPEDQGRVADHYIVQLTAGQPVTFVARGGPQAGASGSPLDMMMFLYLNRAVVMSDDASASDGTALNPRIVFTPTVTGTYVLRVTSYGGDFRQAPYTLQAYTGALETQL